MTGTAGAFERLPEELKLLPQWALAGASKAPQSVDANGKLYAAAVTRPSEWLSFDAACYWAYVFREHVTTHIDKKGREITQVGMNIGFILNEADPFTCIDLDVKDAVSNPDEPDVWTPPERFDFYWRIVEHFNSYTELSRSGKGLHAWVKGKIGRGFRRDGIEIYSQERFIICTGAIVLNRPVENRQMMLDNMVTQMRPAPKEFHLEELEPVEDDWSILERAVNAGNSEKFCALWSGKWQQLSFPSQSEADLALMSMLAFYSESNSQCRRLFRESGLGQREKATKNDKYVNYTLTLIRERQARELKADISAIIQSAETVQKLAAEEIRKLQYGAEAANVGASSPFGPVAPRNVTSLHVPGQGDPSLAHAPAEVTAASLAPVSAGVVSAGENGIPWPPGFAGKIAQFVYQSATRPVKEVAIVAALGLLAGIAGKAWHIPQSGLNLYIILIARSAVGKEAMHSGISAIIKACSRDNPMFHKFVDFTEYASGPALTKACVANPCFVNVSGEWGRKLKRLAQEDGRDGALQTLRTQMTNLYQKSGPTAIVGGIGYSSTDNNVASVAGVSYSMIGETTPGTFYEALTETMMEDGFLSRFLTIEYDGKRPDENEYTLETPDIALTKALNNLATQADLMIAKDYSMAIGRTEESAKLMKEFNLVCDRHINETDDESRRQMWNRAALKSLRLAGLLAVADNWMTPCITREHIVWAQDIIMRDIAVMQRRLESGDVGNGDKAREKKIIMVLKNYLSKPLPPSYSVPEAMRENGIVPRNFIQIRISNASSFTTHKLGANRALDDALASLISSGYLIETNRDKMIDVYSFHGKAYRIVRLPDYGVESEI